MRRIINKEKTIFQLLVIAIILVTMFLFAFGFNTIPNKEVFADSQTYIDKTVHIENNGTILSPNLWRAIKRFYNSNKTEDMERIGDTEYNNYFTIELFKNFPVTTLDLSGDEIDEQYRIDDLSNLIYMDLSAFTAIDLSNNNLTTIGEELKNLPNLESINLSNNNIKSFSYTQLHQTCYSQNLTNLNLSYNKLESCDLSKISQGEIDLSLNNLTSEKLTYSETETVVINLTHNLLNQFEDNANITYGFQGVKNGGIYIVGQKVKFFGFGETTQIKIFRLGVETQNNENIVTETEIQTLNVGEEYLFEIGYYRIKFTDEATENLLLQEIEAFYICPKAPTVKMYQNNEELEDINYQIVSPATLKITGDENSEIYYSINNQTAVKGDTIEINTVGINLVRIYQVVDGYQSEIVSYYINYTPPNTWGWVAYLGGATILGVLFYLAIIYYPKLVSIKIGRKGDKNKPNLD